MTKRISRATFGWILILFGGFLAIGAVGNAEERGWEASDIPLWWFAVTLPLVAGLLLVSSGFLRTLQRRLNDLEDEVLDAVHRHGGAITAAELARSTSLTLDGAEDALRHLSQRGHLMPQLSDNGLMVYSLGIAAPRDQPAQRAGGRDRRGNEAPGGTLGLNIGQLARMQQIVQVVTWVLLGAVLTISILVTVAGPTIWPAP